MKAMISPLTSLRFVAALAVVLYHMKQYTFVGWRGGVIERGDLAVDFFFILSGFILAHAHGVEFTTGRGSLRSFLAARVARLYPVHAAVMLAFAAYVGLLGALGFNYNVGRYTAPAFVAHMLLLPAWNVGQEMTWNYPDWSIGAEFAAYLCFPVLALVLLRWSRPAAAVLLGAVAVGFILANPAFHLTSRTLDFSVLRILPEFTIGLLTYRLWDHLPARYAGLLFGIGIGALATALILRAPDAVIGLLFVPIILAASRLTGWLGRLLSAPPLVRLGEASYSLYMVHALTMSMVYSALKVPAVAARVPHMAADIACLLLTILAALVLHATVERPGRRLMLAMLGERRRPVVLEAMAAS